ncbi:uncharacterized protein LOC119568143 [Penaeus monodon]|uniref:uncharacterized protein LOC119568143 n=1 Tax=Penaeus monodon TaxID=6687 RepID=UPI0018A792E4|nr:uncharacterized protein LOC119568143 [Penaeus monodon]
MTRIAALNDWSLGSSEEEEVGPTREVLEAEAAKCYNDAVRYLAHGQLDQAQEQFLRVINNPYIEKACWPEGIEPGGVLPQDLALKYSCLKNLGNLATRKGEHQQAVDYYLEAVRLDHTEVTLWQRLGAAAIKIKDFELALVAFQEGLTVNQKHWPCLDQLLSVLFILRMYMDCLGLIINALQRDPGYIKALAFKDRIFKLQPSLQEDVKHFFSNSSLLFKTVDYDKEKGDKFVATCESLRPPNKTPRPPSPLQLQMLRKPLPKLSWDNLAQSLIMTYDELIEADPMEFAAKIDLFEALKRKDEHAEDDQEMETENGKPAEEVDGIEKICNGEDNENKEGNENSEVKKSANEDEKSEGGREERSSPVTKGTDGSQSSPPRISSRRQTIELGESQDSFRVSEKRRSVDSDTFSRSEDELKLNEDGQEKEAKTVDRNGEATKGVKLEVNADKENKDFVDRVPAKIPVKESSISGIKEEHKQSPQAEVKKEKGESKRTDLVDSAQHSRSRKHSEVENEFEGFEESKVQENVKKNMNASEAKTHVLDAHKICNEKVQEHFNKTDCDLQEERNISTAAFQEADSTNDKFPERGEMREEVEEKGSVAVEKNGQNEEEKGEPPQTEEEEEEEDRDDVQKQARQIGKGVDMLEDMENLNHEKDGISQIGIELDNANEMCDEDGLLDRTTLEEEVGMEEQGEEMGDDGAIENVEMYHEEEEGLDESEMEHGVTETEAAVNALKGIMALQPTEILGLPEPDFVYDTEYVEYFDGGVYEEDEELDQEGIDHEGNMCDDEAMEQEGMEQEEHHEVHDMQGDVDQEGIDHEEEEVLEQDGMDQGQEENQEQNLQQGQEVVSDEVGTAQDDNQENQEGQEDIDEECVEHQEAVGNEERDQEEDIEEDIVEDGSHEDNVEQEEDTEQMEGTDQEDEIHGQEECNEQAEEEEEVHDQGEHQDQEGDEVQDQEDEEEEDEENEQEEATPAEEELEMQEEANEDYDEREKMEETEDGEMEEEEAAEEEPGNESQEEEMVAEAEKGKEKDEDEKEEDPVRKLEDDNKNSEESMENQEDNLKEKSDKENKVSDVEKAQAYTTDENTASETDKAAEVQTPRSTVSGRKPRRPKRGLERELEQLDYWGRRLERDAKRRRRTISSKLLGSVEEAEYLTWADLLRSFIPNSLLTTNPDAKRKTGPDAQSVSNSSSQDSKFVVPSVEQSQNSKSVPMTNHLASSASVSQPSSNKEIEVKTDTISAPGKVQSDSGSSKTLSAEAVNAEGENKKEMSASSSPQEPEKSVTPVVKSTTEEPKKEGADIVELSSSSLKAKEGDDGELLEDSGKKTKDAADAEDRRLSVDDKEDKETDMEVDDSLATVKKNRKEKIFSSSTEEAQVEAFMLYYEENGGILHLLQQFMLVLLKRYEHKWPTAAAKMYTEIYPRVRNHVFHIPALSLKEDCKQLHQDAMLSLTHWELMVSLYQASKLNTPVKDQNTLPNPFADSPDHLEDDMLHLTLMLGRGDVWMEETPQFHTRLRWLQAQLRLCSGKSEDAAIYMELLLSDLERLSDNGEEYVVQRTCVMDDQSVVCNSEVKRHLNLLQRSQMLEQVVDNYTDGRYRVVADLLIAIFHEPLPKARPGVELPTRQTQLVILIDSLFKLNDQKGVITWGSHALTEALKRFNRAEAEEEKNRWAKTLMKITELAYTTVTKNTGVVEKVEHENITQMVSTLTLMLVIQLEKPQSAEDLPFDTLTPWILLHRILTYEEHRQENLNKTKEPKGILDKKVEESSRTSSDKDSKEERVNSEQMEVDVTGSEGSSEKSGQKSNESSKPLDASSEVQDESNKSEVAAEPKMEGNNEESAKVEETTAASKGPVGPYPSSLFLITAHDELGKHSWCCSDDGVFLLYCLDILIEELNRPIEGQQRQLLHHALEQVSFCLYSHPSKKSKHKHLRDHGVPQIALCWERALQMYQYYVPKELPTFQSSQIPSITDDVAALFKRIIALLPDEDKPENQTEAVEAYICGGSQECNFVPFKPSTDIIDCYYLLGDYYFKNKEWTNAIKYYKLDVSINVDRLDSWAPLGLAMKAMLETQLNSCEVIQDEEEFFSLAQQAVQCLKQALKLDEYHTNLWVEFGGLVYMVHSHASRLLKQDLNPDISLETFEMLEKLKGDMLTEAERCFTQALDIQEEGWDDDSLPDERWLHCYMLGKISEKQGKPPQAILQKYLEASKHLHQIQAKYPVKINYNSPQEYSVEALEMYYRAHAYMLKYLLQREGKPVDEGVIKYFIKVLDELASGPFAICQEKKKSSDDVNVTVAEGEAGQDKAREAAATEAPEREGESRKRPLEEDGAATEPPAKKIQASQESEEVRSVIKEVVNDIISDAAAKSDDAKKEGESKREGAATAEDGKEESKGASEKKESEDGEVKAAKPKDMKESDDEILVVEEKVIEKKDHLTVISRCLAALKLCLSRFPQHYKALYRLAQYYHTSKFHKDSGRARNYLLGCEFWQRVGYMPVNGLFNERKVWIQQPKNSNLFHGIWRIPNDEVDRPGSFAAHMYRCVSITLDILPQMKDFFTILEIALALKNSPDKDKKYLRDNERELLSEHATQVGLQAMKDKYKVLFQGASPVHGNRRMAFLLDVYRAYKQISKHLQGSEPHLAKMLSEAYVAYRGLKADGRANILREAESFCNRNQYLQHRVPTTAAAGQASRGDAGGSALISRRGRPPGTGRGRGRGRGSFYASRQSGDLLAVQQAYKIYESLIHAQTLLNNKDLDRASAYNYQKQLEHYQTQLLKYLHIPSVSQYFQASLQGLGTAAAKLPPPPKGAETAVAAASTASAARAAVPGAARGQTSGTAAAAQLLPTLKERASQPSQPGASKPSLSALAQRSHAHGISITSVSAAKQSTSPGKLLKPNMSVTVSPAKAACPPALQGRGDISVVSVSRPQSNNRTTTTTTSARVSGSGTVTVTQSSTDSRSITTTINTKSITTTSVGSVPKLPAGTTLTRPGDSTPPKGSAPRPQLQAQARPVKNVSDVLDSLPGSMRKMAAEILSNSGTSVTRATVPTGTQIRTSPDKTNRPSVAKETTITPAPRVKSQGRAPGPQTKNPSSFLGAYQASLGIAGGKMSGAARAAASTATPSSVMLESARRAQPTQAAAKTRITQLNSSQLMHLAYGGAGRGAASDNISELIREIAKNQQPVGGHARTQAVTVQRAQGVALQRPPQNLPTQRPPQSRPHPQARPAPPQARPAPPQARPAPPQARPAPPQARPAPPQARPAPPQARPAPPQARPAPPQARPAPQVRPPPPKQLQKPSPPKPTQFKPGQGGAAAGSDDIITLD